MGFRKIIGFGDGSFVVSLPKDWVVKNGLKKGDDVVVDVDTNLVRITPLNNTPNKNENNTSEITIEYVNNKQRFKAELIYAYISNVNLINITGKDLQKNVPQIRKIVESLAALEIVQQSSNKIVLKDMLNIYEVQPHDLVRRLDRIILSMMEDVECCIKGECKTDCIASLNQKETDVNRLTNLMFKVLRRALNPPDSLKIGLSVDDLFYYWELSMFMEKIGDQLKRIPRSIDTKLNNSVLEAYKALVEQYKSAMKANFTKNITLALDVIASKGEIFNKLDYCIDKLPRDYVYFLEKMRAMNIYNGNIAKALLKMGISGVKQ